MRAIEQEIERDPAQQLREAPRPRTLERSFGLIAGILFIGGAFAGIPSSLLIDPAPPASLYLITMAGVAIGLAAMVIPWERISRAWAHVAMLVAITQVGLTVALAGDPFVFYFVFIAIFAAYAFSDRNQLVVYIGLITVALLVPILVIPDSTRATASQALAAIPAIALVAVMVAFLRERLEDNRRTTRRFAREALALSVRIGRLPVDPSPDAATALARLPAPQHPRLRRTAIGVSAVLVAIAGLGALAAVGVALPGPIESSFASVGIEPDRPDAEGDQEGGSQSLGSGPGGSQSPTPVDSPAGADSSGKSAAVAPKGAGNTESKSLAAGPGASDAQPTPAGSPGDAAASAGGGAESSDPSGAKQPAPAAGSSTPKSTDPSSAASNPDPPPAPTLQPSIPDIGKDITTALGNLLGPKQK